MIFNSFTNRKPGVEAVEVSQIHEHYRFMATDNIFNYLHLVERNYSTKHQSKSDIFLKMIIHHI